jgi:outer membrane murein-binding lipoprotein Lpp
MHPRLAIFCGVMFTAAASAQDAALRLLRAQNPVDDPLGRPHTVEVQVPDAGSAPAAVLFGKQDLAPGAPWQILHALPNPTETREVGAPVFTNGVATAFFRVELLGEADVHHPFPGVNPTVLTDVAWGVDEEQSLSVDDLRHTLTHAANWAEFNNTGGTTNTAVAGRPALAWTAFHFWPNILNLTEIYFEDTGVYHTVVNTLLAADPDGPARAAALHLDVSSGERVYLLRDFVTEVTLGPQVFHEVHFAVALNLEARTADEWQVHAFAGQGLGVLRDPRVETLRTAFAAVGGALGEAWDICLRGNQRRTLYHAANVDRLRPAPPGDYWLDRIDRACFSGAPPTNPPPFYLAIPTNRPPPPPPAPPGGREGKNGAAPPPPEAPDPPAQPPVRPWPHKDKYDPPPAEEPEQGVAGGPPAAPEPCPNLAGLLARLEAERAQKNAEKAAFNADMEKLRSGLYEWVGGLTFTNPCLQALYDQFAAQVATLEAQIAAITQQLAQNQADYEAARDGLSPAVRVLTTLDTLWGNVKLVSGPWLDVPPTNCVIVVPGIPGASTEVIIVPENEVRKFHVAITLGLVRGLSWDAAVDAAVANAFNPFYKGEALMESAWRQHAECLRKIVEVQMAKYLRLAFPQWTEEDIQEGVKTAFDHDRDLTPEQRAEWEAFQQTVADLRQQAIGLLAQINGLREQINDLNREFRRQAAETCIRQAKQQVEVLMHRVALLEGFLAEAGAPPGTEVDPLASHLEAFCQALREMIADLSLHQNCPALLAYLRRYEVNCP